jgi:aspartyl-tRNA(Asn)/glutamyl-tRNA(Gln) amidotransferase subunit A
MIYTAKKDVNSACKIVAEDMLLTTDMPTAAGSKMLDGYMSLLEAEVLTRLKNKGYGVCGKADVGEFAIDLLGETSYNGANTADGKIVNSSAEILKKNEADAVIALDVNGAVRRAAAQNGLVSVKPTYGTVSRYGTVPVACSGETVSVMAKDADMCRKILDDIAGHDNKDGTSLPECEIAKKADVKYIKRIAIINDMMADVSDDIKANIDDACAKLGVETVKIDSSVIAASRAAWNILMSAELCNNVSRYDGVKYGHRAEKFSGIDELYTNSRTEAFGELLKTAIIFGSETLSTENYMKVYDKALRTRRVIAEEFAKIFAEFDAVMIPACSKAFYTEDDVKADKYISYKENFYTAPASITGLPAVVAHGVQLIGRAFSENALLELVSKL